MYEIFVELLNKKGVTPYQVSKATGVAQSSLSDWKNGKSKPKYEKLLKIADYFGVTVDYLLGNEKKPLIGEDEELNELMESLKNRPGMRTLFSKTKNATKEDIEKVIKMLDIMKGTDYDD